MITAFKALAGTVPQQHSGCGMDPGTLCWESGGDWDEWLFLGRSGKLVKPSATPSVRCPGGQARLWGCAGTADLTKAIRKLVLGQTPALQ